MNYDRLTKRELIKELTALKKRLSKTPGTANAAPRNDKRGKQPVQPKKSGSPSPPVGHATERRYRVKGEDGTVRQIYEVVKDVHDREGSPLYTEGALYEVTNGEGLTGTADSKEQTEIICRFRPDGTLTYVNEAYCRYFGCEWQDLRDRNILHTISEQDRQKVLLQLQNLNPGRPVGTMECRVMNSFGEPLWNQWSYRAIFDGEGHILEYHSVGRDITYRKYTQEVLEKRAAILEAMITAAEGFLKSGSWSDKIEPVLKSFGKATGANHVFLFENNVNQDNGISVRRRFEWFSPAICRVKAHKRFLKTRELATRFSRWVFAKSEGKPIYGTVGQFPDKEVESLALEPTLSLAVVPITAGGKWWGFVGFADYLNEIMWADDEIAPLEAAAGILGAAIEREEGEQKIREQERFLSNVFDSIQDGIGVLDRDLNIVRANPVMENWPVASRPLVGRKCYESIYGREMPCRDCPALKTLKSGKSVRQVRPARGPDGTLWMEIFTYPLRDRQNGPTTGVIEYVRDITERVNAEEARKLTEERLRTFIDSTKDMVFLKDDELRFIVANKAGQELLGLCEEEILGKTDFDFLPRESAKRWRKTDLEALATESGIIEAEDNFNGRTMRATKFRIDLGNDRFGLATVVRDVTEQRAAEENVRRSEERLRTFIDSSKELIFLKDADLRYLFVNRQWAHFNRFESEDTVLGKKDHDLFPKWSAEERVKGDLAALRKKGSFHVQELVIEGRTLEMIKFKVPLADGRVGIGGIAQDVTEKKAAEEAVQEREAMLSSILRAAPIGISFGHERILKWTNSFYQGMSGYSEKELAGQSPRLLYGSDKEFSDVGKALQAGIKKKGLGTAQTQWKRKDGSTIDVQLSMCPLSKRDASWGVVVTALDITEKKKAEDALLASESRYRELADTIPVGVYETNLEGYVTYVNRTGSDLFGYGEDDLRQGLHFRQVIVSEEHKIARENARGVKDGKTVFYTEHTFLRKDGSRFTGLLSGKPLIRDNRLVGSTGVVSDISDLKKAQEALRKNEALLQGILRAAPIGVGIVHDRVIGWVNEHFTRMTGYAGEDVIGQSARILYPDDGEFERVGSEKYTEIRKGKTGAVETRWRRKDGTVFDVYLSSNAIDSRDPSSGVVFTVYDVTVQKKAADILRFAKEELEKQVTERTRELDIANTLLRVELEEHRKTEEALAEKEQLYRAIVEDQTELICRFHPNGNLSFVNEAFCRYFGKSREELLGTRYRPPIPREDRIVMTKAVRALTPDNHVTHFEIRVELPGQDLRWHLWTTRAIYDEVGRLVEHQAVGRDVTVRVRSQQQIQESRNTLRSVFDGISDPLLMVGGDMTTVIMLNRAALEFFDIEHYREIIGLPCHGHLIERYGRDHAERLKAAIGESSPSRFSLTANVKAIRYEEISVYPVRGIDNGKGLAIIRVTDRTKQVIMERELIQNEKLASLGLLISGIVHEINNPNNFIVFNIPILRDYLREILPVVDEHAEKIPWYEVLGMPYADFRVDVMKLLDNIEHGSHRINVTVAKLKEFSRKREDKGLRAVASADVVNKALSICHTQIRKTVKTFDVEIDPGLAQMTTDPEAIEQVLINLLINAAQAADKEDSLIRLHVYKGDSWKNGLVMEVIDNGCGMDETTTSRIFDPFFTTKEEGCGTGLGLYISKNLVESAGGCISVESKPGHGTAFRVIFPDMESRDPEKKIKTI
jgi:PAS domain S-box-containing protein